MKEQLKKDLDNVVASGNTKISGLEIVDKEVRVYIQSDIFPIMERLRKECPK